MLVNATNLAGLRAGFSTAFQGGLDQAPTQWSRVATEVRSTQKEHNTVGWVKFPTCANGSAPVRCRTSSSTITLVKKRSSS